jgi:Domain found in Dishevelled, Egl-10, and Pleckstrin (DEP)
VVVLCTLRYAVVGVSREYVTHRCVTLTLLCDYVPVLWQCFVGDEAVAWLVSSGKCRDKLEAVIIGNMMLKEGFFHHVLVSA